MFVKKLACNQLVIIPKTEVVDTFFIPSKLHNIPYSTNGSFYFCSLHTSSTHSSFLAQLNGQARITLRTFGDKATLPDTCTKNNTQINLSLKTYQKLNYSRMDNQQFSFFVSPLKHHKETEPPPTFLYLNFNLFIYLIYCFYHFFQPWYIGVSRILLGHLLVFNFSFSLFSCITI